MANDNDDWEAEWEAECGEWARALQAAAKDRDYTQAEQEEIGSHDAATCTDCGAIVHCYSLESPDEYSERSLCWDCRRYAAHCGRCGTVCAHCNKAV